ncbi:hypothetical protein B0H15DRAFT_413159 [Mycena belliarum]|uniref:Uncharacterized protein n=1 Tax=Mycena belliarum TaxID=1033014 RepID=A0AAD6XV30_9AGAR|nr:hypothetical protein B0H15DRAFT_413159 [Mycena belliae]
MPPRAFDLTQVGKLFDEALASIRDNPLDNETLEPDALAWLKTARYTMMRAIEKSYHDLARSVDDPAFRPSWVDPAVPLFISVAAVPTMLKPYERLLTDNLLGPASSPRRCMWTTSSRGWPRGPARGATPDSRRASLAASSLVRAAAGRPRRRARRGAPRGRARTRARASGRACAR